jgi:hypothetical protein
VTNPSSVFLDMLFSLFYYITAITIFERNIPLSIVVHFFFAVEIVMYVELYL